MLGMVGSLDFNGERASAWLAYERPSSIKKSAPEERAQLQLVRRERMCTVSFSMCTVSLL